MYDEKKYLVICNIIYSKDNLTDSDEKRVKIVSNVYNEKIYFIIHNIICSKDNLFNSNDKRVKSNKMKKDIQRNLTIYNDLVTECANI